MNDETEDLIEELYGEKESFRFSINIKCSQLLNALAILSVISGIIMIFVMIANTPDTSSMGYYDRELANLSKPGFLDYFGVVLATIAAATFCRGFALLVAMAEHYLDEKREY